MTDAVPAPVLLDLDPELLLVAVQFLPAADQGRAAQACKLFAILVHEIGRTKSFMVGAVAPLDGLVKRSLADHLGAAPTMGILFSQEALNADLASEMGATDAAGPQNF